MQLSFVNSIPTITLFRENAVGFMIYRCMWHDVSFRLSTRDCSFVLQIHSSYDNLNPDLGDRLNPIEC